MKQMNIRCVVVFAVACIIACSLFAATGSSTYNKIKWTYTIDTTKTAYLEVLSSGIACIDSSTVGDITVPATFNNKVYTNTALKNRAFINCTEITKVTIPGSISNVYSAFYNCTSLTNITFGTKKLNLNEDSFVNCPKFTTFALMENAMTAYAVDDGVLYNADKTQLIRVPTGLDEISIPDTVTKIGQYAFSYSAIREIALPASLQTISVDAFKNASSLSSFSITDGNSNFATKDGVLYSKDMKTLILCPNTFKQLTIPRGVTNIARRAFAGCTSLTEIICPSSLSYLYSNSFEDATALKSVTFKGKLPTLESTATLGSIDMSVKIRYPSKHATEWEAYLAAKSYTNIEKFNSIGLVITYR